jgi:hypothetical protein
VSISEIWLTQEQIDEIEAQEATVAAQQKADEETQQAAIDAELQLAAQEANKRDEASQPLTDEDLARLVVVERDQPEVYDSAISEISSAQARGWPVPEYPELDLADLPPRRAMLARMNAWIAEQQGELHRLQESRRTFVKSLDAPTETEAAIAAEVASGKNKLLAWLRSNGKLDRPTIDAFEREALEARLPVQRHEAEVAKAALGSLDVEIDVLERRLDALHERQKRHIEAAVIEAGAGFLGQLYVRATHDLRDIIASISGLSTIAQRADPDGTGGVLRRTITTTFSTDLPWFDLPELRQVFSFKTDSGDFQPRLAVDEGLVYASAGPWKRFASMLATDARAELPREIRDLEDDL